MNILMANRDMSLGGGSTFLRNVAPALRKRGHRCFLVSGEGETRGLLRSAFDGTYTKALVWPWEARWLAGLIGSLKIDAMICLAPVQFGVAAAACARTGARFVLHLAAPFAARRVARFLQIADSVIVMNEYQRRHFSRMGLPADAMVKLTWMMDWDEYAHQAAPFDDRANRVVYCSRLSSTKGPLAVAFLEAASSVLADLPDLRVQVIGRGSYSGKVQAAVARFNARGQGSAELISDALDTAPYFGQARVAAGGNYVCIEALASGAFAIGAGYDGVFGLVRPDNLEDAAEQYFGDHMTPITGAARDDAALVGDFARALREAFAAESAPLRAVAADTARALFRRQEAILPLEEELERVVLRRGAEWAAH